MDNTPFNSVYNKCNIKSQTGGNNDEAQHEDQLKHNMKINL